MNKPMIPSQATQKLAAQQTQDDPHAGHGVTPGPTHNDIAKQAYGIYTKSGCKQGQCQQNWRQAEHDLRAGDRRP